VTPKIFLKSVIVIYLSKFCCILIIVCVIFSLLYKRENHAIIIANYRRQYRVYWWRGAINTLYLLFANHLLLIDAGLIFFWGSLKLLLFGLINGLHGLFVVTMLLSFLWCRNLMCIAFAHWSVCLACCSQVAYVTILAFCNLVKHAILSSSLLWSTLIGRWIRPGPSV
jgi:hypothetical protein